jgi:hypothetical protein
MAKVWSGPERTFFQAFRAKMLQKNKYYWEQDAPKMVRQPLPNPFEPPKGRTFRDIPSKVRKQYLREIFDDWPTTQDDGGGHATPGHGDSEDEESDGIEEESDQDESSGIPDDSSEPGGSEQQGDDESRSDAHATDDVYNPEDGLRLCPRHWTEGVSHKRKARQISQDHRTGGTRPEQQCEYDSEYDIGTDANQQSKGVDKGKRSQQKKDEGRKRCSKRKHDQTSGSQAKRFVQRECRARAPASYREEDPDAFPVHPDDILPNRAHKSKPDQPVRPGSKPGDQPGQPDDSEPGTTYRRIKLKFRDQMLELIEEPSGILSDGKCHIKRELPDSGAPKPEAQRVKLQPLDDAASNKPVNAGPPTPATPLAPGAAEKFPVSASAPPLDVAAINPAGPHALATPLVVGDTVEDPINLS